MKHVAKILSSGFQFAVVASLMAGMVSCGEQQDNESVSEILSSGGSTSCPSNINWQSPQIPSGNASVVNFSRNNMGRQVGGGECSHLADAALRSGSLKSYNSLGPTGMDADYVWGNRVTTINRGGSASGVLPGDVIQYRNFSQKVTSPNGSWWSSNAAHHTAVVRAVSGDGRHICVYEQNVSGRRTVGTGYINLSGMNGGTLWVYRPRR